MADKTPPVGRPRQGGHSRHQPQHRLNAESVEKKLAVLATIEQTSDVRATIEHFYLHLSATAYRSKYAQIYAWKRAKEKLFAAVSASKGGMRKLRVKGVATVLSSEQEGEIVRFVNELRKDDVPVSPLMLCTKAREVAAAAGAKSFAASSCWIDGFKARHRFSMRAATRQGQQSRTTSIRLRTFAAQVEATVQDLDVTRIFNADQTACFFEYLPTKTLTKTGEKTVWVKCGGADKQRATVMLLGDSTGARYSPFAVFKTSTAKDAARARENAELRCGFGKTVWGEIKGLRNELSIEIHSNAKGWWNGALSVEFLRFHFARRQPQNDPVLLLWDDFSGYWTSEVRDVAAELNVILLKVPPHSTAVSQTADVSWNRPFKTRMRRFWLDSLRSRIEQHQHSEDPFRLASPKRPTIARWIAQAWGDLSETIIANGYRKCNLLPSEECLATAALTADLAALHVIAGRAVGEDDGFDAAFRKEAKAQV